ncbi:hypothetical protein TREMEDRAFT_61522 [Tremella mesenterica DSM 1558]|uniref:uncharacterized protein n=1 Tax=Tremella mesenterica (strain ATCC 24925 / CBS 8224 / DSM 1558 / NBRC 9311 / NRRL Y-6157 / RJB 2259-6 / UBC 559-6) TaxID=578456 RepID=UPI0003F4921C|nr:uncharacterized protein TREMEDRAFT_61522 [Tremella mesenterica DSM 1558]EIW69758.1 hypothetical protein TREMEDRAFT_61522 [Tremella mesenterica DSM 1558]
MIPIKACVVWNEVEVEWQRKSDDSYREGDVKKGRGVERLVLGVVANGVYSLRGPIAIAHRRRLFSTSGPDTIPKKRDGRMIATKEDNNRVEGESRTKRVVLPFIPTRYVTVYDRTARSKRGDDQGESDDFWSRMWLKHGCLQPEPTLYIGRK